MSIPMKVVKIHFRHAIAIFGATDLSVSATSPNGNPVQLEMNFGEGYAEVKHDEYKKGIVAVRVPVSNIAAVTYTYADAPVQAELPLGKKKAKAEYSMDPVISSLRKPEDT